MATYGNVIRSYARLVRDTMDSPNGSDDDLLPTQRDLLARLLFAVAAPSIVTERDAATMTAEYPPSPYARDHAAAMLHDYLTRTYATAADYGLDMRQWDETVGRAAEVLRNV